MALLKVVEGFGRNPIDRPSQVSTIDRGRLEPPLATALQFSKPLVRSVAVFVRVRGHHGEIVQGPSRDSEGRISTVAITLQHPTRGSTAVAQNIPSPAFRINPSDSAKSEAAVRLAFARAGRDLAHIGIDVRSDLQAGCGEGRSTADATAATLAACRLRGIRMTPLEVAQLVREAEGAADPLSLLDLGLTPIWAPRRGELVRIIPRELPASVAIAFLASPAPVSTTALASETVYTARNAARFKSVLEDAERAIYTGDLRALCRAATRSIKANQEFLETPKLDELQRLASTVGAAGLTCSHSGTAAAFHFEPGIEGLSRRQRDAITGLQGLGVVDIHHLGQPGFCLPLEDN